MILIIGGNAQGKRQFADKQFLAGMGAAVEEGAAEGAEGARSAETAAVGETWTDGATADWQTFLDSPKCFNLHLFLRRLMAREPALGAPEYLVGPERPTAPEPASERISLAGPECPAVLELAAERTSLTVPERPAASALLAPLQGPIPALLAAKLDRAVPNRILVTDEIGYGIVPMDLFERDYREQTGRVCCELAARAEQVWRVCCGLGQRIK